MPENENANANATRQRLTMVLLLLVCFGMPIIITSNVLSSAGHISVTAGVQVGGPVPGALLDEDGQALGSGHTVELFLAAEGAEPVHAATVTTDSAGTFELQAPEHTGSYLLKFGGGEWLRQSRPFSFLDGDSDPLELVMIAGCVLDIEFERQDAGAVAGGVAYLTGRVGSHMLFGLLDGRFTKELPFEGSNLRLDGMPPMMLELRIVLGGDVVELEMELAAGRHERVIRY